MTVACIVFTIVVFAAIFWPSDVKRPEKRRE